MNAKTVKPVNYTPEQTAELVRLYNEGYETVTLADMFGKTVKSIVAKLVREKVYVKATPTAKDGSPVVKKDDTATAIGNILKMTENDASSLAKCNKKALQVILAALVNSTPVNE